MVVLNRDLQPDARRRHGRTGRCRRRRRRRARCRVRAGQIDREAVRPCHDHRRGRSSDCPTTIWLELHHERLCPVGLVSSLGAVAGCRDPSMSRLETASKSSLLAPRRVMPATAVPLDGRAVRSMACSECSSSAPRARASSRPPAAFRGTTSSAEFPPRLRQAGRAARSSSDAIPRRRASGSTMPARLRLRGTKRVQPQGSRGSRPPPGDAFRRLVLSWPVLSISRLFDQPAVLPVEEEVARDIPRGGSQGIPFQL